MICALLVGATGCIIVDGSSPGNGPQPGNITLEWSFEGQACADTQVSTVQVSIPGEALANDGRYACSAGGVDGITLHDFATGTYTVELKAESESGELLFQGSSSVVVNGDVALQMDLTPP
ncbi:MAG: hypothetical protein H6730_01910 [Deltaproteobacteria bacterium]|nr:hypothetical protein [Deltaproteobacteria bacterium]